MKNVTLCIVLFCLAFASCGPVITGKEDRSLLAIELSGYVTISNFNRPASNVIVKLKQVDFASVTNSEGYYNISITKDSVRKLGLDLNAIHDTVEYFEGTSLISKTYVAHWIDTLPALFIIQRNIYGKLLGDNQNFNSIEAVLFKIKDSDTIGRKKLRLWHNTTVNGFSGYLYFQNSTEEIRYSTYINVFNKDFTMVGRSPTIEFNDDAGDIEIPSFNPFNALPRLDAGRDTVVSVNDTIRLHAEVIDSFGGAIKKWEWKIDAADFTETTAGIFAIPAPPDSTENYQCVVRVTDYDGMVVTDTIIVNVCQDIPAAFAGQDTAVYMNSQYMLHGKVHQKFGTIVKWEWNINNEGFKVTRTGDTTITIPDKYTSTIPCVLRVTDDDGNQQIDTTLIYLGIWGTVGELEMATGWGEVIDIMLTSWKNDLYAAYCKNQKLTVKQFNGSNWVSVWSENLENERVQYPSMTIWNEKPSVAFFDSSISKMTKVMRFNGSEWKTEGLFSGFFGLSQSRVEGNDKPYVAYRDEESGSRLAVQRYKGTLLWDSMDTQDVNFPVEGFPIMVSWNGTPYVAYQSNIPVVMRFNGLRWEQVGEDINEYFSIENLSITMWNGTPYIAFSYYGNGDAVMKPAVMRCNGSAWESVGTIDTKYSMTSASVLVIEGIPYILCYDTSLPTPSRLTMLGFVNNEWQIVGVNEIPGITQPGAGVASTIWKGKPAIAFIDYGNMTKITVTCLQ